VPEARLADRADIYAAGLSLGTRRCRCQSVRFVPGTSAAWIVRHVDRWGSACCGAAERTSQGRASPLSAGIGRCRLRRRLSALTAPRCSVNVSLNAPPVSAALTPGLRRDRRSPAAANLPFAQHLALCSPIAAAAPSAGRCRSVPNSIGRAAACDFAVSAANRELNPSTRPVASHGAIR